MSYDTIFYIIATGADAEIELQSEGSEYTKPSFIGLEVSGDPVYYNSNLINLKYEDLRNYKGIKNNI